MTAELTQSQKEALYELRWDEHKVYIRIKDAWREKILEAYGRLWIKEIEEKVLDFIYNTAKDIFDHINKECM